MSKALSVDLRERVLAAVMGGASRRAAAARFGVGISSAIRWCAMAHETGSVAPGPLGGDRRSARVEAHAELIKELVERQPDATLSELQTKLAQSGLCCSQGAIWRFFKRHQITRKKRRPMRPSKTAPTS